ncbi:hypothetical protein B296_00038068 [Ensete ventricosum]|uniref:Uncharacterized protein n=1 Tax=Ensete ventricosum TaxID=4639 RepID=A0A426YCJ8_ENSVE|nr:hypothetical protein B296_00038068 [Ensete ventricosum]
MVGGHDGMVEGTTACRGWSRSFRRSPRSLPRGRRADHLGGQYKINKARAKRNASTPRGRTQTRLNEPKLGHLLNHTRRGKNPLQSANQDGLLLGQIRGGVVDRVSRPVEPESPTQTTNVKVAGLPTLVTGRCPADPKTNLGGKIITAPTLA